MYTHRAWTAGRLRLGTSLALTALSLTACSDSPTEPPAAETPTSQAAGDPVAAAGFAQLTLWTKQVIGTLPGKTASRGRDVSDNGVVVGESMNPVGGGAVMPFYWTQVAGIRPLPVLSGATEGSALAISDNGLFVTGNLKIGGTTVPVRWVFPFPGAGPVTVRDLPRCSVYPGTGTGVNDGGAVVGNISSLAKSWANDRTCPVSVVVQSTTMTQARGVNDLGTIVGYGFQPQRGFYRSAALSGRLLPLSGDSWSAAHAVNDVNLVVGMSWRSGVYSAVSWSNVGQPTVVLGAMHSAGNVAISDKSRAVWGTPNGTAMTRKGTTSSGLNLFPHGVNACGDIAGTEGGIAVLYKKRYCD